MLNSAAACSNTQANTVTVEPVVKATFDWMSFLNQFGKLLALSHVTLYK